MKHQDIKGIRKQGKRGYFGRIHKVFSSVLLTDILFSVYRRQEYINCKNIYTIKTQIQTPLAKNKAIHLCMTEHNKLILINVKR